MTLKVPANATKIKKEAGIKKSGFLKKSDANVSKHLKAYQAAHKKYEAALQDPLGQIDGVARLVIAESRSGRVRFRFKTVETDLSAAAPAEQAIEIELRVGPYQTKHQRRWKLQNGTLRTRG